jgi:DNA mismatch repair protein MutL
MSSVIKILPQFIANRIAAGEVVGRPDAVVKELIENAIDAKAQNIQVRIKDAGKSLIHIIDDGSGMSEEDALLCFGKYYNSRIQR